ncbi:hypothetical protein NLI96_g12938 [Meripilus lineatus]|uniref:Uncharacterized protein n=1 Tax=Meripilus lineatus TaxID=2056292 RepID=A0AAD5YBY0_9APHY|nr:hypothetical protein NLI96_g12938 [Physisporinus lineatus]
MPPTETLRSLMLKKKLFRKVQGQGLLSPVEELALAAYGPHRPAPPKRPSLHLDDIAIKDHKAVGLPSQGLKLWVNRPCFEDRMAVFLPDQDTGVIKPMRISGSGFGVAALEYSESLEILAGIYDPQDDLLMMRTTLVASPAPISPVSLSPSGSQHSSSPPSPSAASPSPPPPSLPPVQLPGPVVTPVSKPLQQPSTAMAPNPQSRTQAYKAAAPSPLRMETSSSPVLPPVRSILTSSSQTFLSSSSSSSTVLPAPTPILGGAGSSSLTSVSTPTIVLSPTSPEMKSRPLSQPPATSTGTNAGAGTSKPGVRFAEEDKEDQIPLGYVLRIKQKREEKARFLRAERQRRAHEEERRKHEEEKRKQDEEKKKWEVERAGWEKERRAMEEERKKRAYAEEVAASRSRRESQRFGMVNQWVDRVRQHRGDRRQNIRPAPGPAPQLAASSSMRNESPGSSRPPSIGGSGSASGSVRGSMYSTPPSSTPDVNSRERRESKASRRTSNISDASQAAAAAAAYLNMGGYAAVGGGYPWNMSIPPVPVMPVVPVMPYMMDMPLLPPNPPFMLQQFGRPHSPSSSSHHNHNSSNGSYNSHNNNRSQSSSPAPGSHRLPASQSLERVNLGGQRHGSGNGPGHERRSSGDIGQIRRDRDRERDYKERESSRDARTREKFGFWRVEELVEDATCESEVAAAECDEGDERGERVEDEFGVADFWVWYFGFASIAVEVAVAVPTTTAAAATAATIPAAVSAAVSGESERTDKTDTGYDEFVEPTCVSKSESACDE